MFHDVRKAGANNNVQHCSSVSYFRVTEFKCLRILRNFRPIMIASNPRHAGGILKFTGFAYFGFLMRFVEHDFRNLQFKARKKTIKIIFIFVKILKFVKQ